VAQDREASGAGLREEGGMHCCAHLQVGGDRVGRCWRKWTMSRQNSVDGRRCSIAVHSGRSGDQHGVAHTVWRGTVALGVSTRALSKQKHGAVGTGAWSG
jgi:hypothetical protein